MPRPERLEQHEKINLKGSPRTAAAALAVFKILCKKQRVTPVPVAFRKGEKAAGMVFTLKERPTFRARFNVGGES